MLFALLTPLLLVALLASLLASVLALLVTLPELVLGPIGLAPVVAAPVSVVPAAALAGAPSLLLLVSPLTLLLPPLPRLAVLASSPTVLVPRLARTPASLLVLVGSSALGSLLVGSCHMDTPGHPDAGSGRPYSATGWDGDSYLQLSAVVDFSLSRPGA